jgi:hypothetical protein
MPVAQERDWICEFITAELRALGCRARGDVHKWTTGTGQIEENHLFHKTTSKLNQCSSVARLILLPI